jgi:hypothetical protein
MNRSALVLVLPLVMAAAVARADGDGAGPAPQPAPAAAAPTDTITLKDGRRLEGEVVGEDDRFISLRSGGVTRMYAKDSIASVEKAPRAPGQPDSSANPGAAPSQPPAPPAGKEKKKDKVDRRDAPLSEPAKAWLAELLAKAADADESVRRSIGAAIGALGPQAIPAVRAAQAAAPDGPQKQFLDKLAGDMESRRDRRPGATGDGMGPDGMQPGPDGGRPGGGRRGLDELMQRVSTELQLRDDQKPKVEAILQDVMKRRFEIARDARRDGLTAEQVAEKVTPLRADLLVQMKTVLDEAQNSMFEEMAKRLFDMQRPGGPTPPKPADGGQPKPPEPAPPKPDAK